MSSTSLVKLGPRTPEYRTAKTC